MVDLTFRDLNAANGAALLDAYDGSTPPSVVSGL